MADSILVDSAGATGSYVVYNGACYARSGESPDPPEINAVSGDFEDCNCSDSSDPCICPYVEGQAPTLTASFEFLGPGGGTLTCQLTFHNSNCGFQGTLIVPTGYGPNLEVDMVHNSNDNWGPHAPNGCIDWIIGPGWYSKDHFDVGGGPRGTASGSYGGFLGTMTVT